MSKIDLLYQKKIMEESKSPYHFEKKDNYDFTLKAFNPICGDKFDLFLKDQSIYFHGFGCTISKASTSFMARELEGKSKSESIAIVNSFLKAIENKEQIPFESLKVFENSDNFRGRFDCIMLAWKAFKEKLEEE